MTAAFKKVFFIAEAGVNHNGRADLALKLVDAAAQAGADAVKFQHFDPGRLVRESEKLVAYQEKNTGAGKSQFEMLSELCLSLEELTAAANCARNLGLEFLCTPFDIVSANEIAHLVPAWKVSSTDLTNFPFIDDLAKLNKPIILSSGMATMEESRDAVDYLLQRTSSASVFPALSLLHSVSAYPAPLEDINLNVIPVLKDALNIPIGFSDHTTGINACIGAAAKGAQILEKHFTLDRELPGPDHAASLEVDDLSVLIRGVRDIEVALGNSIKAPQPSELTNRDRVRRSLHAARDLEVGHRLDPQDIIALRPADGIEPGEFDRTVGRLLRVSIQAGDPIKHEHLDGVIQLESFI